MIRGGRPMGKSGNRHTGEKTYIYAQDLGKELRVVVVNLEPTEAVVLQVNVDAKKLGQFIQNVNPGRNHHGPAPREETKPVNDDKIEFAASSAQSWNGVCLF